MTQSPRLAQCGELKLGCVRWASAAQTAWAAMALMACFCVMAAPASSLDAVRRAVRYLVRSQGADGDWPRGPITGVYSRTVATTYPLYRNTFPLWALAEWSAWSAAQRLPLHGDVAEL